METPGLVTTVNGDISADDLGMVSLREHIYFARPGWDDDPLVQFNRIEAIDKILAALKDFKAAGGGTLVDFNGTLLGRDPELMTTLARGSGINIVASTGFAGEDAIPGHFKVPAAQKIVRVVHQHGVTSRVIELDKEYLAELFYKELTEGMTKSGMMRTNIRAGVVRAGCSPDRITETEDISIRGAAIAARRAGVALSTIGISQAQEQLRIIQQEGLDPNRIIMGRCDDRRALNPERDKSMARSGVYVAYDHVGWEDPAMPHSIPDERRVELVKAMVEAGCAERIVLSCMAVGCAISMPQPKHTYDHLLTDFVPKLRDAGMNEETIHTILVDNPKRILTRNL